ncbi:MAG: HD domain-containing protein [Candidatus Latescibacteria bacterium]|nr:HD domain-containing protein [Candidatus Latescibacterota bacterium]NIM21533.1 HD domain-containing protein [Candidatus Latescibacterota bacterium]NIM65704.1 HD domain-containing protein [Candidatus Latescibacterota bacterium]NIO02086.1 HD domain-containing protein [Candidatus Latescibacterota bacterium]NIO28898.1 HD domain-containing protein [Candidatus Latescibacterota bacterium]
MPHAQWQEEILKRGELYYVGGSVRDRLLGLEEPAPDTDYLVRKLPPDELEEMLSSFGSVHLVGKAFGVYKFTPRKETQSFDIAYPRKEASTGPGHRDFKVDWDWDLPVEADLGRRDFTINAIAQSVRDGTLVDPLGGAKDILQRRLRMVFPQAFEEDPLRILRGARFAARFSLVVENRTIEAMRASARLMGTLSQERVQEEFTKLLTQCDAPSVGLTLMHEIGVLNVVFPELDRGAGVIQNEYHPDDVFVHSLKSCDCAPRQNLAVRWAALLHDLGKVDKKMTIEEEGEAPRVVFYGHEVESAAITQHVLRRLRYSNAFVEKCQKLVRYHMFDYQPEWSQAAIRRLIRRVGEENMDDMFLLREADCRSRDADEGIAILGELKARVNDELSKGRAFKLADLAIGGADVMEALGLPEGPEVGKVLDALLEAVIEDPALNTREKLIDLARKGLAK